MPGKKCPNCGELTFFGNDAKRECSECGYTMTVPPNDGKGGKGTKCSSCNKQTVFNGKCSNCGAIYRK